MRVWSRLLGSGPTAQERYIDEISDWMKGGFGGIVSATGLRVTIDEALTVPGVSACIQVLSEDSAKVPLLLYRRLPNGDREKAEDHPLYAMLKQGPAPWLSSFAWRRAMAHAALTRGNAYSRVWRTESGRLDRITPIQTGKTSIRWADDGEPFFDVASDTGVEKGLTWQDVIHVPYRGSNDGAVHGGVLGISPIVQNRETVALSLATERFAAKFFANGARPSAVLEYDKRMPNDEVAKRIREGLERTYAGVDNAFKIAILELGMKLKEFSFSNVDSQLIEIRKEQAVQACTMYGVPPHKIGILDRATNNNIEHQGIDYVTGPVSSLARNIESAIAVACLTPDERETLYVEHNLEGLMRGDILSRYRAYAIGRQWGWLSADDVRGTENQNKLPAGQGEQYLTPMNMSPAGEDPTKDDPAPQKTAWMAPRPDRVLHASAREIGLYGAP